MCYLDSFKLFALQTGLPFTDVYTESKDETGTGRLRFISNVDYIHLSYEGRVLVSQLLASKLATLL